MNLACGSNRALAKKKLCRYIDLTTQPKPIVINQSTTVTANQHTQSSKS
jgi:hypothetical protein